MFKKSIERKKDYKYSAIAGWRLIKKRISWIIGSICDNFVEFIQNISQPNCNKYFEYNFIDDCTWFAIFLTLF